MSEWINNKKRIFKHNNKEGVKKPCRDLLFCPYGSLVEEYPLKRKNLYSCKVFGHECPVFYQAEFFSEDI